MVVVGRWVTVYRWIVDERVRVSDSLWETEEVDEIRCTVAVGIPVKVEVPMDVRVCDWVSRLLEGDSVAVGTEAVAVFRSETLSDDDAV